MLNKFLSGIMFQRELAAWDQRQNKNTTRRYNRYLKQGWTKRQAQGLATGRLKSR